MSDWQVRPAVCFTGHRPDKIGGYDPSHPMRIRVRQALGVAVDRAAALGFETFISGMAQGVDQDAASVVLDRGLRLIAAIPFPGQESLWPPQAAARYRELLARAHEVVTVSPGSYHPRLMQARNEWMADRSSLVIAVWDGSPGGTANMLRYARGLKPNRAIWRINPAGLAGSE